MNVYHKIKLELLSFDKKHKFYNYFKIFICINPLLFCLIVIVTDFVDYKGATESAKYILIAQKWLGYSSNEVLTEFQRLPLYPLFISFVFKIFGYDNFIALLIIQSLLGVLTFIYLIKTLERLELGNNLIILLTLFFNLSINYRFSIFYPNSLFLFLITMFVYNFTCFYFLKNKKNFYLMSFFIFLMLLTRPIFQLSLVLTFPIIIYFVIKKNFSRLLKFKLISVLILSYFLGIGTQYARNYNEYGSFVYTTQSGMHLSLWLIPCLSQKYGCGSRNTEVRDYIEDKWVQEISGKNYSDIEKNKILSEIGIDYFIHEMDKKKAITSIFFSYIKLFFHPSLTEMYLKFQINFKNFSSLDGESFFDKFNELIQKTFTNTKYLFWSLSLFFLFIMRIVQIIGVFSIFKNKEFGLYTFVIVSLIGVIIIPALGMGNPRYRSEIETLLIILGAIGIKNILDFYKNRFL
ncbi:glycosyltransferase family 39 protein [Candidatus Pelagibacter sp.]|nr:glycosyltransferase family 39 protein [Candidatus Pelagibacter sp.]